MRTRAERITIEAAQWVARLDADPTARGALNTWLAEDPRHAVAWMQAIAAWERLEPLAHLRGMGESPLPPRPVSPVVPPPTPARQSPSRFAAAAAFALAALALGWTMTRDAPVAYETPVGSFQRVALADGSTLELNTNTRITVRLTGRARELHLQRGEATFVVASDRRRPFTVLAGDTEVQAVGTAFNVRLAGQSTRIVVTEGIVGVRTAAGPQQGNVAPPVLVESGHAAVVRDHQVAVRDLGSQEAERLLAWRDGSLAFTRAPLSEVVAEFNRYNERKLLIEDPAVAALIVGGYFRANDLDAFLAAIARTLPVSVIARGRDFVITRREMSTSAGAAEAASEHS
jgi:transmembrane sensor